MNEKSKTYSRVYADIRLDAILSNLRGMKERMSEETQMIAVIKADGYGHGAVPLAELLEQELYIWGYAVATLDEALVLKKAKVEKPVLVLGCVFPDQYEEMLKREIRMNVYTEEMAEAISHLAQEMGVTAYMHIKLDTGMGRLGFEISEEGAKSIARISKLPAAEMEGIFTHFARADEKDKSFTQLQFSKFQWLTENLEQKGVTFKHKHCSNSAAILDAPETHFNLVRAGISMYGLYPSDEMREAGAYLIPAMELVSHVAFVKEVPAGTPISYGGTFVSDKSMKIATIPVGYGDGYPRSLSNKGEVLIHGQRAPIVGRICMDQFMVDVTDIEDVRFEDEVVLVGTRGEQRISVEELGELSGRFNYEFVCDLGKRIPRVYRNMGEIVGQTDYFD